MWRLTALLLLFAVVPAAHAQQANTRTLSYRVYLDKVQGGWTGKAIGLAIGVPKEYNEPWPPSDFDYFAQTPTHFSDLASGDDVYVPLVFQLALKKYGIGATQQEFLQEWHERLFSGRIWVSCEQALDHFRAGVKPPKTGMPGYNSNWDDMCSQMSTDVVGWITPGMINAAAAMGDYAAHVVNWGVGADGGIFTAALDSEAFFTSDIENLIRKARAVLPAGSRYGEMVDDLLRWRKEQPDWRMTRQMLAAKYNPKLAPRDLAGLINGGVVVLGLLYGDGDFGKSMLIAQKCRWDSDTNASTAAGVMGTVLGYSRLEPRWRLVLHDTYENYCVRGLPRWLRFSDIARDSVELGEQGILKRGGKVTGSGVDRTFLIPAEQPGAVARTEAASAELIEQLKREMESFYRDKLKTVTERWDSAWSLTMCGFETPPEVLPVYFGRQRVLKVCPGPRGAILERTVTLAPGKQHFLKIGVAHHPTTMREATGEAEHGSWRLEVMADGGQIGQYPIYSNGGLVIWEDPQFDLTKYAGKTVKLTLAGRQTSGSGEFSRATSTTYWSGVEILTMDQREPWR